MADSGQTDQGRAPGALPELGVLRGAAPPDPFDLFRAWLDAAGEGEPHDPNAMTLATATPEGRPSARVVLLKGLDERGFVFYTNGEGRKGRELAANPFAALCFYWKSLRRQVRVEGAVETVTGDEADAYFRSRARGSQVGAWASRQSAPHASRRELEDAVAAVEARFGAGDIPRPAHWTGFRVVPDRIEFWQNQLYRLHDRLAFTRAGAGWRTEWLNP